MEDRCRIKTQMEANNTIGNFVYVIWVGEGNEQDKAKSRQVEGLGTSGINLDIAATEDQFNFLKMAYKNLQIHMHLLELVGRTPKLMLNMILNSNLLLKRLRTSMLGVQQN
jgi:hypothetical protein